MKNFVLIFSMMLFALCAVAQDVELPVSHEDAGVEILVPDTVFFKSDVAMGKYWEPFTDIFGDGTIAIIAGAYPEGMTSGMNAKVAFIGTDGSVDEYWAFYNDAGEPYTGEFNEARKDGNPPRMACDRRPGGTMYVVGEESTPFLYDGFNDDGRWDQAFLYTDKQVAAVQAFNKTANGPEPLTNVIDPVYGIGTIDGVQSDQMRFGGDIRFLSDGNILVVVEDRNKGVVAGGNGAVATIFDSQTAQIVKGPFNSAGDDAPHSIWANVAAYQGGFAVRTEGIISTYDNAGNLKHVVAQADWTTVADTGRGDGTRIAASINGDMVYILGKRAEGDMVVSSLNPETGEAGKEVIVSEEDLWLFGTFDRGDLAVDDAGNVCVAYVFQDQSLGAEQQVCARILDSNLDPLTPTFFAFSQFERWNDAEVLGITSKEVNVSMDNQRIVIAANGVTVDSDTGELTPEEHAYAVVLKNPVAPVAVDTWELF
jgi:hypothetical protein